ncbi:PepSY-like domain-containing protein [candidate division KSB1 bacterium]
MKNCSFLILVAFAISFTACSQVKVPAVVKTAFDKEFQAAKKVTWEQEEDGYWEAVFKMEGKKMSVTYDAEGNWLETETMIKTSELPENLVNVILTEYEGFEIDEVESLETPDFSGYEVEIEKEDGKEEIEMEFMISHDGQIVKKETKEDEDEGDDNDENENDDEDEDEEHEEDDD